MSRASVSFAFRKKRRRLETGKSDENEDDEDNYLSEEGALAAPRRKAAVSLLEDAATKALRLKAEGNTLAEGGRFRAALARWLEASQLQPDNHLLYDLQSQAFSHLGEYFKAIKTAERALELSPDWSEGYLTLARAQLNFGEFRKAKDSLSKFLEKFPSNEEALEDLSSIEALIQRSEKRQEEFALTIQDPTVSRDGAEVASCFLNLSWRGIPLDTEEAAQQEELE